MHALAKMFTGPAGVEKTTDKQQQKKTVLTPALFRRY